MLQGPARLGRLWGICLRRDRGERKGQRKGGKEGRKKGEKERDIMSINDIVHLHLPSPIHFTSTQFSCLLAVTIQPFMGRMIYAACTQ